jgi:hypothetical protein
MDKRIKGDPHTRAVFAREWVEGLHSRNTLSLNGALGFHPRSVLLCEWAENKKATLCGWLNFQKLNFKCSKQAYRGNMLDVS